MSCNRLIVRSAAAVCFVLMFTAGTLAQNVVNDHTAQGATGRKAPSNSGHLLSESSRSRRCLVH